MREITLSLGSAMGCRHCVREVTRWLRDVPGVETIAADAGSGSVVVRGTMNAQDVLAVFAGSEYRPRIVVDPSPAKAP